MDIRKAIQYRKELDASETRKNIENHVPATEKFGLMLEILSILRRVVDIKLKKVVITAVVCYYRF
ncbi:YqaJ domain-containing protein [Aphis craccivora]|uniref:YqaJ domain-containing protein n=1 Tax=Aphis craccivora TaxID=307492 RepID=A0A6G0XWQ4_APHCR|nr:YqaJ domain-containing protein [Aphis craccivora]